MLAAEVETKSPKCYSDSQWNLRIREFGSLSLTDCERDASTNCRKQEVVVLFLRGTMLFVDLNLTIGWHGDHGPFFYLRNPLV